MLNYQAKEIIREIMEAVLVTCKEANLEANSEKT